MTGALRSAELTTSKKGRVSFAGYDSTESQKWLKITSFDLSAVSTWAGFSTGWFDVIPESIALRQRFQIWKGPYSSYMPICMTVKLVKHSAIGDAQNDLFRGQILYVIMLLNAFYLTDRNRTFCSQDMGMFSDFWYLFPIIMLFLVCRVTVAIPTKQKIRRHGSLMPARKMHGTKYACML